MDHLSAAAILVHFSGVAAEASARFFFNSEFHCKRSCMMAGRASVRRGLLLARRTAVLSEPQRRTAAAMPAAAAPAARASSGHQRASNARVEYMANKALAEPSNVDMLDWQILRASRQPGPGEYKLPGMADGRGIRLPKSKPPGFIDGIIAHANDTPAPGGNCHLPGMADQVSGGRIGTSVPKGMLDWVILREKELPGPAAYHPEGVFGSEMVERAQKRISGVGACSLKNDPTNLTVVWEEKRARALPGAKYDTERSYQFIHPKKGVKMTTATEKSVIEWIEHRARQTPGPVRLNLPARPSCMATGRPLGLRGVCGAL
jgi:hypothetical protein